MPDEDDVTTGGHTDEYATGRSSKFKFKSSRRKERKSRDYDYHDDAQDRKKRRRNDDSSSSHRRHHRRRRSDSPRGPTSTTNDSTALNPDAAFRESLFDALADDEGAEYWEGVYGQPIHIYPNTKEGPEGELEQMTEEEYATHVRNRMWEKSHQHLLEERRRREEQRRKDKAREEQQTKFESERADFDSLIEDALRRGNKRKKERGWQEACQIYIEKWEKLLDQTSNDGLQNSKQSPSAMIPWPVTTGKQQDVSNDTVQAFFQKVPHSELLPLLKAERVRWHPDKMQQRFRGMKLDEELLRAVTAVFQIVDNLWSELRITSQIVPD